MDIVCADIVKSTAGRDKGKYFFVLAEEEGRRKTYAITDAGRETLLAEYRRLKRLVADGAVLEGERDEEI